MPEFPPYFAALQERFGDRIEETAMPLGEAAVTVKREAINEVLAWLKDDDSTLFDLFLDLTGVDYIRRRPRFEVVIHLVSVPLRHRLRVKVRLDQDDPVMPSIIPVYPAANWFEREAWDLYGLRFSGHPNLKRMLLYESFVGHPLRKDYPLTRRQPIVPLRKPEVRRSDDAREPGEG
ncbi:MAG: NADH-quinone oxidoreductase subunit C [Candidatus Zixiibacteriota bacterium]|nr:MAG: NADH-quinone oxidoreductase subunit C [candidate division Zixibacteria bacterium]